MRDSASLDANVRRMDTTPPDPAWQLALRVAAARDNDEQTWQFLALVDRASGRVCRETARALLATFSARPDYGTQERVCGVLSTGDPDVVLDAILQELPRLVEEAPDWAEVLFGGEVHWRPAETSAAIRRASPEARRTAIRLLRRPDFARFYANSGEVLDNASV